MPQLRRRTDVNLVSALEGGKKSQKIHLKIHRSGIGYVCKKFHGPFMSKSLTIRRITPYLSGISGQDKWTGGFNIKRATPGLNVLREEIIPFHPKPT